MHVSYIPWESEDYYLSVSSESKKKIMILQSNNQRFLGTIFQMAIGVLKYLSLWPYVNQAVMIRKSRNPTVLRTILVCEDMGVSGLELFLRNKSWGIVKYTAG